MYLCIPNNTLFTLKSNDMTLRLSPYFQLLPAFLLSAAIARSAPTDNNVIIDREMRVYSIQEKGGRIASVKSECNAWYLAQEKDGNADALVGYNDNISIDKASATGAKPYYRSWDSPDVFYDGVKVCYLNVPLKKGKPAKVTFCQTYRAPEHFCNLTLTSPYYIKRHATTIVKVPAALAASVKVEPFRFPDNITLSSTTAPDGSVTYTVEAENLQPLPYEPYAPSTPASAPQIIITGQFAGPSDLYRHFRTFIDEAEQSSPELDRLAEQLRAKAGSFLALIDSTAAWVRQNIRYLAIEHGEYAFRPAPAADVLKSRAGDCKGSANLIKALLRKNGLDGRIAWIGTEGEIPFDWDKVPALCSGNHVIAACMLADSLIYLDGTTTWASPGYIPPSIRGRRVMVEDGDDCILANVPEIGPDADREEICAKYDVVGNDLVGRTKIVLSGVNKMSFLSALASREPRERQKLVNRMLAYPNNSSNVDSTYVNADLSLQAATIMGKVRDANAAQTIGDKIYLDIKPLRDSFFNTVDTAGRTRDFHLPYGYSARYDISVAIPDGYSLKTLPEPMTLDNDWHKASIRYSVDDGEIRCEVEIATKETETPLARIPERNEAVKSLRRHADLKLVLTR